jgi:pectin methylesterase-like acyl-CoA thioesterase
MFVKKCLRPTLFVVLVLVACFAGQAAQAAPIIVGICKTGIQFPTINAAVAAAPALATIDICPGTYAEQVTITKSLT